MPNLGPTYRMADRLLDGRMEERLRSLRAAGVSYEDIKSLLYDEGKVEASTTTLRRWARMLGIEDREAVA